MENGRRRQVRCRDGMGVQQVVGLVHEPAHHLSGEESWTFSASLLVIRSS
jgi:hypothetical protein